MLLEEKAENYHNYFTNNSSSTNHFLIFLFHDQFHHVFFTSSTTDFNNSKTLFDVVIGFASCTLLTPCGSNVMQKILLDFQSHRKEAPVHRSA